HQGDAGPQRDRECNRHWRLAIPYRSISIEAVSALRATQLGLLLCVLAFPIVSAAQVEKVVVRTTGISCGACAAISEIQFRRMPGVKDVSISLSTETITISYKPGSSFDPQQIREVLEPLNVRVVQFHITARGRVRMEGENWIFVAAVDKFGLAAP